ncbi:hypothetical protein M885DRAFT_535114 [Pelagophyceae sp. CCMP2097]|nr:hypothetical protein M885DRAFT_535114 [Pelagophyceae sp. CCMP2097]
MEGGDERDDRSRSRRKERSRSGDRDHDRSRERSRRKSPSPERKPKRSRFSSEPPPAAMAPGVGVGAVGGIMAAAAQAGLVPAQTDMSTKPYRELFVGNTPPLTTERALLDHLNAAMATARLATAPGAAIVTCRVSTNFAFIEFRTIEDCDRGLNLTGIPFMGQALKIGRPSKYDGPMTPCASWQQVSQDGGSAPDPRMLGGGPQLGTAEKTLRELFIGNTTANMSEGAIKHFLCTVAREMGQVVADGEPIVSLRLSGHYAFVELRSAEETDAMLQFSGIPFCGSELRIGRPSKYATNSGKAAPEATWGDVLQAYRDGALPPLAREQPPKLLARETVAALARVAENPTRVVRLAGLLATARAAARPASAAASDALDEDVCADIRGECSKYGNATSVEHDGGDAIAVFTLVDDAILAVASLRHRRFMGDPVDARFVRAGEVPQDAQPPAQAPPPPPPPQSDQAQDAAAADYFAQLQQQS